MHLTRKFDFRRQNYSSRSLLSYFIFLKKRRNLNEERRNGKNKKPQTYLYNIITITITICGLRNDTFDKIFNICKHTYLIFKLFQQWK